MKQLKEEQSITRMKKDETKRSEHEIQGVNRREEEIAGGKSRQWVKSGAIQGVLGLID